MSDAYWPLHHHYALHLWSCKLEAGSRMKVRTRADVEFRLVARALRNSLYRARLVANPRPLVEVELGGLLPGNVRVEVLEEMAGMRYFVLPQIPPDSILVEPTLLEQAADWIMDDLHLPFVSTMSTRDLVVRVWKDPEYLQQLVHDPGCLLVRDYQAILDEDLTIHVRVETSDQVFIVLPELKGYVEGSDYIELLSAVNEPLVIGSQMQLPTATTLPPCCPATYPMYMCN